MKRRIRNYKQVIKRLLGQICYIAQKIIETLLWGNSGYTEVSVRNTATCKYDYFHLLIISRLALSLPTTRLKQELGIVDMLTFSLIIVLEVRRQGR